VLAFPLREGLGDQSSSLRRSTRSGCHTTGLGTVVHLLRVDDRVSGIAACLLRVWAF
jgi:hypothetical protein